MLPCVLLAALALAAPQAAQAEAPPMQIELNLFGQPKIYRYGVQQDYFYFTGWGLPKAFEGVPEAVYLAERYQLWATTGHTMSFVGSAAIVGSVWYLLAKGEKRSDNPAVTYVLLGGGLLSGVGTGIAMMSNRLIYQAVNVFNERVQPEMLPEFHYHTADGGRPEYRVLWSLNR